MPEPNECGDDYELIQCADALNARACEAQRAFLEVIAGIDRQELWQDSGAHTMDHWVSMRYGISYWKAERWIAAAHALQDLPLISEAFAAGELSLDKVVELTRFATPETEERLLVWAQGVSSGAIRHQADLARRAERGEAAQVDQDRSVRWWYFDQGRRFGLHVELPAAQGAVVTRGLDREAGQLPVMPGEEGQWCVEARRADALVAMCSVRIAQDPDPDRATVIIHARVDDRSGDLHGCEIEGGPAVHTETVRRLACTSRVQVVLEDASGTPVGLGRMSRDPSTWMMRQLKYRHRECVFPGCGARRYTQAHHVVWWERGGRTDMDNLVLVCTFHHKLVHEYRWSLKRDQDGTVRWFHSDGTRYRAGPGPPQRASALGRAMQLITV